MQNFEWFDPKKSYQIYIKLYRQCNQLYLSTGVTDRLESNKIMIGYDREKNVLAIKESDKGHKVYDSNRMSFNSELIAMTGIGDKKYTGEYKDGMFIFDLNK